MLTHGMTKVLLLLIWENKKTQIGVSSRQESSVSNSKTHPCRSNPDNSLNLDVLTTGQVSLAGIMSPVHMSARTV